MTTHLRLLLLTALAITFSGCIVNPIYYARDLISISGMEGIWETPPTQREDNLFDNWEIVPADGGRFLITRNDGNNPQYYMGGFLKLGGILYLDVADTRHNGSSTDTALGVHSILKIFPDHDTLRGLLMDLDYLDKCIKNKKYTLKHETSTDHSSDYNTGTTMFITASTAELQAFMIGSSGDVKLFPPRDSIMLHRGDGAFNRYFPKESFDVLALRQRPETPQMLKQAFTPAWKRAALNPLALIDSLTTAPLIYRPFYFRIAGFAVAGNEDAVDSAVAGHFSRYVLSNTREFLHYFYAGPGGGRPDLERWANIVSQYIMYSTAQDEIITRLSAADSNWTTGERRMQAAFTKLLEQYLQRRQSGRGFR